eukprot:1792906-Alexandrium_andersonii.AAC.1
MPQQFYNDLAAFTVDHMEIPGMRLDLTRGFRNPRGDAAKQLELKVRDDVETLRGKEKNLLET